MGPTAVTRLRGGEINYGVQFPALRPPRCKAMHRTGPTPLEDLPQLLHAVGFMTLPNIDRDGSQLSLFLGSRRWPWNGGTCCARVARRVLIPHMDESGRRAADSPGEILVRDMVVTPAMHAVQLKEQLTSEPHVPAITVRRWEAVKWACDAVGATDHATLSRAVSWDPRVDAVR